MKLSHKAALAGLALAVLATPVAAQALSGDSGGHGRPPAAGPSTAVATPDDPAETEEPAGTDDAGEPGADPTGQPAEASAAGRAHALAMQAWTRCVAAAASGPKTQGQQLPPKTACPDKPVAPGRAKHLSAGSSQRPSSHGHGHAHGRP